nr:family 43 glycosylhydrolase [Pedobacter panaciterrae]
MRVVIQIYALVQFCAFLSFGCGKKNETVNVPQKPSVNKHIEWDYSTLKKVSSSAAGERYCGYARMIQLHDQSLVAVYEADGNVVSVKSADLGATWSAPVSVAKRADGTNMSVPDILELKDHSLLASYNPRPYDISPSRKFGIRTKKSYDGGLTWTDEKLLYEAGYEFKNGCWEPSAIQLPNGEIQLYFANEGDYLNSDEQNISMLRSTDNGLTWTKKAEIVSFRAGKRDGMPVPLLLNNGKEIVFAIEDNGFDTFKPYIIRNSLKDNWASTIDAGSSNRSYALADKIDDKIYAGAPYLRQLKTGETILSYQGTEGRTNKMEFADMKVVIGDDQARNFNRKSTPFIIPANKSCLWNSVTILNDNTIVAVASTNAYSNHSEIWMIKGRLVQDPIALADPTIFLDNDKYYLYGTSSDKGFEVYESSDLKNWKGPVGKNNGFALVKGEAFGSKGFWAPQVFKHKNAYYMAYTADEQIAIAKSDSPLGPFKQEQIKALSGIGKQIDPFVFFDTDGKTYMYHVKLKEGNRIFVSEMKPDLSDVLQETTKECISGVLPWENTEKTDWPVTEGPTVIKHKNLYYLIYSSNDFRNKDYAVGYATSTSPLGPWKKYAGSPIISREKLKFNGTGHGDLFTDKAGNYKYVMHTHHSPAKVSPRSTGIIDVKFAKENGSEADVLEADESTFKLLFNSNETK